MTKNLSEGTGTIFETKTEEKHPKPFSPFVSPFRRGDLEFSELSRLQLCPYLHQYVHVQSCVPFRQLHAHHTDKVSLCDMSSGELGHVGIV